MSEMVERCTDAFWDAIPDGVYIEGPFDAHTVIRAVIEAMREPTIAMYDFGTDKMWKDRNSTEVWQSMITAALT